MLSSLPPGRASAAVGRSIHSPFRVILSLKGKPLRGISPTLLCSFIRYGGQCLPGYYLKGLRLQRICNYLIIYSESKGMVAGLLLR